MGVFSQTLLPPGCSSPRASSSLKMSDRKAVIKNADMSEEMQQDAVDCATQALENTTSKRILQPTSRKSLTKNTTLRGIVLLEEILAHMLLMKQGISSIFIWDKWQSFYLKVDKYGFLDHTGYTKNPTLIFSNSQ